MNIRDTLLLVNHNQEERAALRSLFEKKYNILEAWNGEQALMLLEQNHRFIVALLMDVEISGLDGWAVMQELKKKELLPNIPVVMMLPEAAEEQEGRAFEMGASDVVIGSRDLHVIYRRVDNIVELNRYKWNLEKTVEEQTDILRHSNDVMVDALSSLIEYRSVESGQHILRIRHFTRILMEEILVSCPEYRLDEKTVSIVASASALHDIGKIAIPDAILNKPGDLTSEERELMKTHALTGSKILEELDGMGNEEYLRYAHNICHYHHERWDGKGYPEGLKGDSIPICAQVVGLADAYDALTNKRVYKDAFSHEKAVNMILQGECGIFSPKLLECFKIVSGDMYELAKKYADGHSPKNDTITIPLPEPERQDSMDTLAAFQAKYHTILHYIDGAVVEMDVESGIYHLVYNPYQELAELESTASFEAGVKKLIRKNFPEEHQGQVLRDFFRKIRTFMEESLRKQAFTYRMYSPALRKECDYEVVFLRLRGMDSDQKRMIMIWRRLDEGKKPAFRASEELPDWIGLEGVVKCRIDRWLTLEGENQSLAEMLGYTVDEIRTRFQNRIVELMAPEERGTVFERLKKQLSHGKDVEMECRLIHKEGHPVWILNKGRLFTAPDGKEYLWGKLVDVTKTHYRQGVLQQELERHKIILSQVDHVIFDWDIKRDQMIHSERWISMFGYEPIREHFSDRVKNSHLHPEDIQGFQECLKGLKKGEPSCEIKIRLAKADGRYLWCLFRATTQYDEEGNPVRAIGVILNVDESERAILALQDKAERDGLTGLMNKKTAREQVELILEQRKMNENEAMLILDLDNFKQVNDRYGHMFGDAVLSQAAQEIRKQFRADDITARIGGDEFMVFMKNVPDQDMVRKRCEKLVEGFGRMFEERLPGAGLTCSLGVAMAPLNGVGYQELFHAADKALYQAKKLGKNQYAFYDVESAIEQMNTAVSQRIDSNEEMDSLAERSLIHYVFHRLYQSGDVIGTIDALLGIIGKQMNVSRVYIFENDAENTYCRNTFEWCNAGISPEIQNLQNISYETDIPGYEDNFDERGIFYCPDVRELPKEQYEILEPQGIKSMLQCAIRDNGQFRGYVGFDENVEQRLWTKDQIETLSFLAEVLSLFLLKHRAQMETDQKNQELIHVLDKQANWIYVVDPVTLELLYINEKARKAAQEIRLRIPCYEGLRGRSQQCEDCPLRKIDDPEGTKTIINHEHLNLCVEAEAMVITWNGEEGRLLTCTELKK